MCVHAFRPLSVSSTPTEELGWAVRGVEGGVTGGDNRQERVPPAAGTLRGVHSSSREGYLIQLSLLLFTHS